MIRFLTLAFVVSMALVNAGCGGDEKAGLPDKAVQPPKEAPKIMSNIPEKGKK